MSALHAIEIASQAKWTGGEHTLKMLPADGKLDKMPKAAENVVATI